MQTDSVNQPASPRTAGRFRRAIAVIGVFALTTTLALIPAAPASADERSMHQLESRLVPAAASAARAPFDLNFLMSALIVVLQQAAKRQQVLTAAEQARTQDAAEAKKAKADKAEADKAEADKAKAAKAKADKAKAAKAKAAKAKAKARTFKAMVKLDGHRTKKVSSKVVRTYKSGSMVQIKCQAYGPWAYGSPVWDKTIDNVWVTDHYVLNHVHNKFIKGMPRCDHDAKTQQKHVPLPVKLNSSQIANAKLIIAVGKGYHIPKRGWEVAIATAMQESRLRNPSGGDRDSVGMFQQRPSTGWGSVRQCTTRTMAIRAFYGIASHTHNPGLTDIRGWQKMSITRAAQAVQRSAYPSAYAKWESLAKALVANYADQVSATR